jgi:hypothetical protein
MKIMRVTGLPVDLDNLEKYKAEWTEGFDMRKAKHGNDMLSLQEDLASFEKELNLKYPTQESIEYPKTQKAMKALVLKYQAPVMIAQSSENIKEFVFVIMDQEM